MDDTNEKLRIDVVTVRDYARDNMNDMRCDDYVAMMQVCAALTDALNAATPPADAALADRLCELSAMFLVHDGFSDAMNNLLHESIRRAADALRARAVPDGFVMVPVDPTADMFVVGGEVFFDQAKTYGITASTEQDQNCAASIYRAMLADSKGGA